MKPRICTLATVFVVGSIAVLGPPCRGEVVDVPPLVATINQVAARGTGHRAAIEAWQQLARAEAGQIPAILAGMGNSGELSVNWLRSTVETIASRQLRDGGQLPQAALEDFLTDRSHAPRARRIAYELIVSVEPSARQRLIPGFLDDPSMELRREAVAHVLGDARKLVEAGDKTAAISAYSKSLSAGRDLDQVDQAADRLAELGQAVDLPRHFGFIMQWHLAGPFDNTNKGGFDVQYGPELDSDISAKYAGKEGVVQWSEHTTEDKYGVVDINKALGRYKGAVAYAYAEFSSDSERDVQLRLGCINGNKLWLNGEQLFGNHVYHSGTHLDQYVGTGRLKKGKNVMLLKILQNEQDESWAQRWQFQLRVCDQYGTAVLSQDRKK